MGGRRKPKGDMTRLLGLEDGRGHGRSMRKPPVAGSGSWLSVYKETGI